MRPSGVLRFALAAVLIGLTAMLLYARGGEIVPQDAACTSGPGKLQARNGTNVERLPLSCFPKQLANWDSTEVEQDKETLDVLGHGDFMERIYRDPENKLPSVDLFVAYFASQRAGETPHSPQHCLPGSGWNPDENVRITLSLPGHGPFPANRYVISKGGMRELVLYWFWAHDRGVASEYLAKYYLIHDAIRMNRSDGSLVRFVTPILPGEAPEAAQQRVLPLIHAVFPLLDDYIPR
jgi:EpsI family protein